MRSGDTINIKIKSGICPSYLTQGKTYQAVVIEPMKSQPFGPFMSLNDDNGLVLLSDQKDAGCLAGGEWEIVE